MNQSIAIAVSGGIDSLVAAYLLKEAGHNIFGVHFTTGTERKTPGKNNEDPSHVASQIADQLGIEVKLLDCSVEFQKKVVDYFTQTYQTGKTPNPCMVCNPTIKFGSVLDFSRKFGATSLATGHYARTSKDHTGRFHLYRGIDDKKDQSYFLALLNQQQLARACFPLGHMKKTDVFKLAANKGLEAVKKSESQDICFIKDQAYGEFLAMQTGFKAKPGIIEDVHGNVLGSHNGLHLFTIGQRRGINCPAAEPYYVVGMDPEQNRLKVGFQKDVESLECKIENINWINPTPNSPINVHTRVRYRHTAAASKLFITSKETAIVRFETPQSAVTPGQCAVFYRDAEVLGGGWISRDREST
jgi:tRNA-specific 2-thiouridylase